MLLIFDIIGTFLVAFCVCCHLSETNTDDLIQMDKLNYELYAISYEYMLPSFDKSKALIIESKIMQNSRS